MNRITRTLAIGGLGLGAALVIGAGPAQAAAATTQPAAHSAAAQTRGDWDNNDDVVGYFRNRSTCERVGSLGEDRGRWDDYDCSRVRFGFNRGAYVLEVSSNDWNGNWDHDNWYDGWYNNFNGGDWDGGWSHWGNGWWNHGGHNHGGHGGHNHFI